MKIIHTEERDLLDCLRELGMEINEDGFEDYEDFNDACAFFNNASNREQTDAYILAKALSIDNFYELNELYITFLNSELKNTHGINMYSNTSIYDVYKAIIKSNIKELRGIDNESFFWDFYDFDSFGEHCKEFYKIGECDFNDNHYIVVESLQ